MISKAVSQLIACAIVVPLVYAIYRLSKRSRSDYVRYVRALHGSKRSAFWIYGVLPFEQAGEGSDVRKTEDVEGLRNRWLKSDFRFWAFVVVVGAVAFALKMLGH